MNLYMIKKNKPFIFERFIVTFSVVLAKSIMKVSQSFTSFPHFISMDLFSEMY